MADMKANMLPHHVIRRDEPDAASAFQERASLAASNILVSFCLLTFALPLTTVMPKAAAADRDPAGREQPVVQSAFFGDFTRLSQQQF